MRNRYVSVLGAIALLFCAAAVASAQYETGFENIVADPNGIVLTGQDGYYIPTGTTSTDFKAYTYAGNILGVVQNPEGQLQFIAGEGPGGGTYARAQHDIDFIFQDGVWKFQYDTAALFTLTGIGSNNIGSFSCRSDEALGLNDYIHLLTYVDVNNPTSFNWFYLAYSANGVQFTAPGQSPGPGWEGLAMNHWYRAWTIIDTAANLITEVGIIDLTTMVENVAHPAGWYLDGGSAGGGGYLPEAFRFFGGGGSAGNATAWDNLHIIPGGVLGACCLGTDCIVLDRATCDSYGGVYQGDGTVCDPNPCIVQPTGACCVGAECSIQTADACQTMGGTYMGDGTICDPNPCLVPTKVTTWGDIKSKFH